MIFVEDRAGLFGRYENFPENYHGIIQFHHPSSPKKLQEIILQALNGLGQEERLVLSSIRNVSGFKVNFDFGIADGATFSYLDSETLNISLNAVLNDALSTLDFLCVARYYRKNRRGGGYKPLKFDYYFLRFLFYDGDVDFEVFHERGPRHLTIGDLTTVIIDRVDKRLMENGLPKIAVEYVWTL